MTLVHLDFDEAVNSFLRAFGFTHLLMEGVRNSLFNKNAEGKQVFNLVPLFPNDPRGRGVPDAALKDVNSEDVQQILQDQHDPQANVRFMVEIPLTAYDAFMQTT